MLEVLAQIKINRVEGDPEDPAAQWTSWAREDHHINRKLKYVVSFGMDSVFTVL
jgi:hypothetical protein